MKIEKLLIVVLFILIAIAMIPNKVNAAIGDEFTVDGIKYTALTENTVEVSEYEGDLTNVTIPKSVTDGTNSYNVTSIGESAFSRCKALESVTIPNSVTSIGDSAFEMCDALTNIVIPDSITSISNRMLYSCDSLENITIPDSVTSIDDSAFSLCVSLKNISIPKSVQSIGKDAFSDCVLLEEVSIPEKVQTISAGTFFDCEALKVIEIPESLTTIEHSAFWGCNSLTEILIPDSVTFIGEDAFKNCTNLKIHSYAYSVAAKYAEQNNIDFEAMYKVTIDYYAEGITISTVEWAEMTSTGMFFYLDEGACVDIVIEENDGCEIIAIFVNDIKQDLPLIDNTLSIFDINEDVEITINSESYYVR